MMLNCNREKFQKNMVYIRNVLGIGQIEFGNLIGVTRQTIYNIEHEKTDLSETQFLAIKYVFEHEIESSWVEERIITEILEGKNEFESWMSLFDELIGKAEES